MPKMASFVNAYTNSVHKIGIVKVIIRKTINILIKIISILAAWARVIVGQPPQYRGDRCLGEWRSQVIRCMVCAGSLVSVGNGFNYL